MFSNKLSGVAGLNPTDLCLSEEASTIHACIEGMHFKPMCPNNRGWLSVLTAAWAALAKIKAIHKKGGTHGFDAELEDRLWCIDDWRVDGGHDG